MPSSSLTLLSLPNATGMRNGAGVVTAYPEFEPQLNSSVIERLSAMQAACLSPPSVDAAWMAARRRIDRRSKLSIGQLGCSTSAGCGALSPSIRCSMPHSWGRRAHDVLASAMPSVSVETSIFQKNSVEASFFLGCTRELLPARPDVIIVEVLQTRPNPNPHPHLNPNPNLNPNPTPNTNLNPNRSCRTYTTAASTPSSRTWWLRSATRRRACPLCS